MYDFEYVECITDDKIENEGRIFFTIKSLYHKLGKILETILIFAEYF